MKNKLDSLGLLFQEAYGNDPRNLSKALQVLKDNNASQMESVKTLISTLGLSLKEADNLVRESEAWASTREHTDRIRNSFWDSVEEFEE